MILRICVVNFGAKRYYISYILYIFGRIHTLARNRSVDQGIFNYLDERPASFHRDQRHQKQSAPRWRRRLWQATILEVRTVTDQSHIV